MPERIAKCSGKALRYRSATQGQIWTNFAFSSDMTLHVPVLALKNKALTMWHIPACIAVCGGIILAVWSHKIDNRWRFVPWVSVKEKRNVEMTSWRVSSDDCIISNKSAVSYRDADLYHVARQLYFFTAGFMTRWKELCAETDKTPVYSPSVLTDQRGFGWDLMSRANQCPARWLWLMPLKKQSVIMVHQKTSEQKGWRKYWCIYPSRGHDDHLTLRLCIVPRCRSLFVWQSHLVGK